MTVPPKRRDVLAWGAAGTVLATGARGSPERLERENLPPLPMAVAGQFAGVHNGALLVAGGAYFPISKWAGGAKKWVDKVFVLTGPKSGWQTFPLGFPLAYGGSIGTPGGLLLIGGSDEQSHRSQVSEIRWKNGSVEVRPAGALPIPLANCGAAEGNGIAYVVGGQESPLATKASRSLYALDLTRPGAAWKELAPLPGPGRILPAVAAVDGKLFVAGGADLHADAHGKPERTYLRDAWCYTPHSGWQQLPGLPRAACAAPAGGYPDRFLVFGGSDGVLAPRENELRDKHPGFSPDVLVYRPSEKAWKSAFPLQESLVTTTAAQWDGWTVIPGGEDRPAHRSANVTRFRLLHQTGPDKGGD